MTTLVRHLSHFPDTSGSCPCLLNFSVVVGFDFELLVCGLSLVNHKSHPPGFDGFVCWPSAKFIGIAFPNYS